MIPLGGLGEIGKNMTVIRFDDEILIIDAGLMFPEEELLGIDVVIPDISYLLENKHMIRGIVLTHGHEDHIGALPYILRDLNVPVFGTALTIGLVDAKLKETGMKNAKLYIEQQGKQFRVGRFRVELIPTCHSIPDASAIAVHTPYGVIFHTGDFKIDQTPVDGKLTNFQRIAELGHKGVLLMMSDSTNAERAGYSISEKVVGKSFDDIFRAVDGRIIIATFASNVHRVQQVIDAAHNYRRKVAVAGRSLINTVTVAQELGYLKVPKNVLIDLEDVNKYPEDKIVIITTGSQGEPMSGLSRMAMNDHRKVQIMQGDTIILSANPIPGNEKLISRVIDMLFKQGANVIQGSEARVHVSGHAYREDLKLMLNLVKPKYFMPVHGEYSKLLKHALLAEEVGMAAENVFISENGNVLEVSDGKAAITGKIAAGRVLIDGLGVGDVGNIVLRDRKQLSQDGIVIVVVTIDKEQKKVVSGPDLVSRGFVYVREADELMDEAKEKVVMSINKCMEKNVLEWSSLKAGIREALSKYLFEKTRRKPMILPIIMEI